MTDKEKIENADSPSNEDSLKEAGDIKVKVPVSGWLENFWYHYKWHTIAVLFVLIVSVVIIVQCASKPKYDVHILYAGDKAISTSKSNPERQQFLNAFRSVSSDFDENGEVSVAFKHLYSPDDEELAHLAELEKSGEGEIPYSLIYDDQKTLDSLMMSSEYYLLFLDRAVFDRLCERGVISSVRTHLPEGYKGEIAEGKNGASGIYLRDTGFYKLEGIKELPEDTVICIRLAGAFATEEDLALLADAVSVFRRIAQT